MTTFTTKEILEAAEMFRSVPNDFRGMVVGAMMGINIANKKEVMPDMVNLALTMTGDKPA